MKCICGYEKVEHWRTDDGIGIGDEDFITIDCFGKPFETSKRKNNWNGDCETTYLYACPKCGTVKMDI